MPPETPILTFNDREAFARYCDPVERTGLFPWWPAAARSITRRAADNALPIVCYPDGRTMLPRFTREERQALEAGQEPDWRESTTCPSCGLCARQRFVIHTLDTLLDVTNRGSHIYLTESGSPLELAMSRRYPRVVHSEYVDGMPRGTLVKLRGHVTRNEDLTRLSFPSHTFDVIASFDVLEHIPDYRAALADMTRCVNAKGALLLSAPFNLNEHEHVVRARLRHDGSVEHLLEPEYHGDPNSSEGVLCFYHFGWRLLDELRELGFRDVSLVVGQSERFGYFGWGNIMVLARDLRVAD